MELDQITVERLDDYARERLRSVSAVSANNELRAFGSVRTWANARGVLTGPAPKPLRERPPFRVRSWTPAEVRRLLGEVTRTAPAIYPLVLCLAHTGLRRGEALALRWENVDGRMLRIWPSDEWSPKSGRPREVPISDALYRELQRLPRCSPYVFTSRTGDRYAYWPQRSFDRARDAAGLQGGAHTLRHSYATEFLARGEALPLLAQILGHTDERVTRLYAHLRPEHLEAARNVVTFGIGEGIFSTAGRIFKRLSIPISQLGLVELARGKLDSLLHS